LLLFLKHSFDIFKLTFIFIFKLLFYFIAKKYHIFYIYLRKIHFLKKITIFYQKNDNEVPKKRL
jgi:hypothetical protein